MKKEPSIWKIRAILCILILVLFVPLALIVSITPLWVFTTPLYVMSVVGWFAFGRLLSSLTIRIPKHAEYRPPLKKWAYFASILLIAVGLGYLSTINFVSVVTAPIGVFVFLDYDFVWNVRLRHCTTCQKSIMFRRYRGKFYCEKCGSEITKFNNTLSPP